MLGDRAGVTVDMMKVEIFDELGVEAKQAGLCSA